jgi:hypothetical protein
MASVVGTDPSVQRRATCRSCAAIVEYSQNETREVTTRDYAGDTDVHRELTCPRCGHGLYVSRY